MKAKRFLVQLVLQGAVLFLGGHCFAVVVPDGGADGGGGEVGLAVPVSKEDLRAIFKQSVRYLLPVLNYHEENAHELDPSSDRNLRGISWSHLRKAQARLFPPIPAPDVFEILGQLEFVPKENGACVDLKHKDKDASAFNERPNEICVSLERLAARLTSQNVMIESTALLVHELVHRMGGDEDEAAAYQNYVRAQSLLGSVNLFQGSRAFQVEDLANETKLRQKKLVKEMGRVFLDPVELCLAISDFERSVEKMGSVIDHGLTGFRYSAMRTLYLVELEASQLLNYCRKEPDRLAWWEKDLPMGQPVPASKFLRLPLPDGSMLPSHDLGWVQRIPRWNLTLLRLNFAQLSKNLDVVYQSLEMEARRAGPQRESVR